MDRHALIRVLADPSRFAVYEELAAGSGPASIGDLAERLDLHPNTVRLHLEKLRDAGMVDSAPDRHGSVGRPHHLWSLRYGAPTLGMESSGMRLLAHLLADLAAGDTASSRRAAEVGRRRACERPSPAGTGAVGPGRCLDAVTARLAEMGFDPGVEPAGVEGEAAVITFNRCPFRELAALYPDLVCQLHRGLTEGLVAEASAGTSSVASFSSLVDADPCRAEISVPA